MSEIVFLKGKKVILRPMNKETDLDLCTKYINDPEVRQYLMSYLPWTKDAEAKWFDSLAQRSETDIVLAIEDIATGKYIGSMGLHRIDWKQGIATTGALIGDKDYWGKGYGTDAKMILLDYAFNALGLRKILSAVIDYNKRSLNYSLHCGYKIEGVRKKQIFRNGRFHDEILLAVFKKDWLPIWKRYKKTGSVK
ncbi:MAG: GNAT family N-acetyltransferase [Candidatus Vogelbacteria bacterium]|nr:GNAT family N-acetyltransferase [Candidatus Vogelbacteria bacterium]